ncbi:COP9 signalosome complex subunit 6 [Penicillium malachiteum]|uniref:COP9 signalosome complex subunit 6 n=1 Tax=Penicillium malachiteum TaxID=1324776 RepID=UPI002549423F|nr:COP9 signalosome complex subunit 6 [Penicillium malachiteum]KAJ5737496.1 COP9 signalosome complex subunit 6 [Penicillium malachiteum]
MDSTRSLVSQKTSDSDLHIQLHPLVLLTISDHITRHAARQQQGRVLGALLGQQNGQVITLEHAFECPTTAGPNGEVLLPWEWFEERVKQFKDVHKAPPLELVGWWSTSPATGPDASHLPIHRQLLEDYNESAIFLAFHPSQLQASESHSAKLPLTVYESVLEGGNANDASKDMQIDGEESGPGLRFRELRYSVETEESEMIGVNTIVQNSGTAATETHLTSTYTATSSTSNNQQTTSEKKSAEKSTSGLTQEEEERTDPTFIYSLLYLNMHLTRLNYIVIGNLTTRCNAIRTLESRIGLMKSYVSSICSDPENASSSPEWSYPLLRDITSLISHLELLSPSEQSAFSTEVIAQKNDVLMASLLGRMGEGVKNLREVGYKNTIVRSQRQSNSIQKKTAAAERMRGGLNLPQPFGPGAGNGPRA